MHLRRNHKNEDEVIERNANLARIILNNNHGNNLSLNGTSATVNLSAHGRRLKTHAYEPSVQIDVPSLPLDSIQESKNMEWHREELKALSARLGLQKRRKELELQGDDTVISTKDDEEALIDAYLGTLSLTFMFIPSVSFSTVSLRSNVATHSSTSYTLIFIVFQTSRMLQNREKKEIS